MTGTTLHPHSEAFDRLDLYIAEGRLLRYTWAATGKDGRERAGLIVALWPECGVQQKASVCPAGLLPPWLAHLAPWIDDAPSEEAWPLLMPRAARAFRQLHRLDAAALRRCEYRHLATCVREAASHTSMATALAVCDRVASLCDRVVDGDEPTKPEWAAEAEWAARAAEWAAAEWAAAAAARAAWATAAARAAEAEWAARAAEAAEWAEAAAARAAAAAEWAAEAAEWAAAAARAAEAAEWAAADRIVEALLASIEAELEACP
jgi:hypothetical protein